MESGQQDLLVEITSFLSQNTIPYMVTGAWSVIYYGRPRASHDIDFVVEIHPDDASKILKILSKLSDDFEVQDSLVKRGVQERSMFNIVYKPYVLKLDFWLLKEDDPFDQIRFARKQLVGVLGTKMYFSTAEDTILQKLRWYKQAATDKNIIDAAFVYQIQRKNLDMKYLSTWAKLLKVTGNLKKLAEIDLEQYI